MAAFQELSTSFPKAENTWQVNLDELRKFPAEPGVQELLDRPDIKDLMIDGRIPLITPYNRGELQGTRIELVPQDLKEEADRIDRENIEAWNKPELFLARLKAGQKKQVIPHGKSKAMKRVRKEGLIVAFDDLRLRRPYHNGDERESRTEGFERTFATNIMGVGRLPLMLGSMPDITSREILVKSAQSGMLTTAARDKIWGDPKNQAQLIGNAIQDLRDFEIPEGMQPSISELHEFWEIMGKKKKDFDEETARNTYIDTLRNYWISNVGGAIEASPKGIDRAKLLYEAGCRLIRVYSPEGGHEIPQTVAQLRKTKGFEKGNVQIIAGQVMHKETVLDAQKAGCDAVVVGVGGGSQCLTSQRAGIAVNTTELLDRIRRSDDVKVPVIVEGGGVGDNYFTALALGMKVASKPSVGINLSGAGDMVFVDNKNRPFMVYDGEASPSSKYYGGRVDRHGRPLFVEGAVNTRIIHHNSFTQHVLEVLEPVGIGLVFQQAKDLDDFHTRRKSMVRRGTPAAVGLSDAYGRPEHR